MAETPQFERLLKMLVCLSGGIRYTAAELAERYGTSIRTIRRDKLTLLNAGFAIEQKDGYYWIDKIEPPFKDLHHLPYFTEEEAWIMRRAIHSIDETSLLKINLVEKLYALYKYGKVAEIIVKKQQSEVVAHLTNAIKQGKQVLLHQYRSANSNTIQNRMVEPFDFTSNFIAVWAFDIKSQTNKTFKIARINKVSVSGESFQFQNLHKSLPLDVFRISGIQQTRVKLKLSLRAFNLLMEEYPLSEKFISKPAHNYWLFDAPVSSFEGVGRFILGLCGDVEVIEPDSLKLFLQEKMNIYKNTFIQ
jgi:proteasome accessory factor C